MIKETRHALYNELVDKSNGQLSIGSGKTRYVIEQ